MAKQSKEAFSTFEPEDDPPRQPHPIMRQRPELMRLSEETVPAPWTAPISAAGAAARGAGRRSAP
jgi:hypothetical protein